MSVAFAAGRAHGPIGARHPALKHEYRLFVWSIMGLMLILQNHGAIRITHIRLRQCLAHLTAPAHITSPSSQGQAIHDRLRRRKPTANAPATLELCKVTAHFYLSLTWRPLLRFDWAYIDTVASRPQRRITYLRPRRAGKTFKTLAGLLLQRPQSPSRSPCFRHVGKRNHIRRPDDDRLHYPTSSPHPVLWLPVP